MKKLSTIDELRFRFDWKSLIKAVAFIGLAALTLFVFINKSYFAMLFNGRNMDGKTTAVIIDKNTTEQIVQNGKTGNRIDTELRVKYRYNVNGTIYSTWQRVEYAPLLANSVNRLRRSKLPLTVDIKYNTGHPEKSVIWLQ